jgi:nucleotidyltransferase substrate binding protein (TIGR01987 family)
MQKAQIKLTKFREVLVALEAIYLKPETKDRAYIDATIQRFEFTFELSWKFLKDYFAEREVILNYPKEVLKEAYAVRLINNEPLWLQMLYDRNMTAHAYDEDLADEIYARIRNYVPEFRLLLQNL